MNSCFSLLPAVSAGGERGRGTGQASERPVIGCHSNQAMTKAGNSSTSPTGVTETPVLELLAFASQACWQEAGSEAGVTGTLPGLLRWDTMS